MPSYHKVNVLWIEIVFLPRLNYKTQRHRCVSSHTITLHCWHLNRLHSRPPTSPSELLRSCISTLARPIWFLLQNSWFQLQSLNKTHQQSDLSASCLKPPEPWSHQKQPRTMTSWQPSPRPTSALRHRSAGQGSVQIGCHGDRTENNQTANVPNCIFNRPKAKQCFTSFVDTEKNS